MTMQIKIGIVGSRSYTNKQKIKDFIFRLKEKYGENVIIVSGGSFNKTKFSTNLSTSSCRIP